MSSTIKHDECGSVMAPETTIMSTDTSILLDLADPNDPRPMLQTPWLTRLHDVPYAFAADGARLLALRLREGEQPYSMLPRGISYDKFDLSVRAMLDDTGSDCRAANLADLRAWAAGPSIRWCGACDDLSDHEICPACRDSGHMRYVERPGRILGQTVNLALLIAPFARLPDSLVSVSLGEERWGARPVRFIAPDWRLVIMPLKFCCVDPAPPEFTVWR